MITISLIRYSQTKVAMTSKATRWLFWNILTKGKANMGRKSEILKILDQCAMQDNTLGRVYCFEVL